MNEKDLTELKGLLDQASGELQSLEAQMRGFVQKESRIMELLSGEVAYERSFSRGAREGRDLQRALQDHTFLRKVSMLIPDLQRSIDEDKKAVKEVRGDLEEALVLVGDTEMTLGTLLRALEGLE